MDLSRALPDEVILEVYDEEWVQAVDYEHISLRCRKCHEHGHLFRDCPINKREDNLKIDTGKDPEGFTKVGGRRKGGEKSTRINLARTSYQVIIVSRFWKKMGGNGTDKESEDIHT